MPKNTNKKQVKKKKKNGANFDLATDSTDS